jgi:hypothetical protein
MDEFNEVFVLVSNHRIKVAFNLLPFSIDWQKKKGFFFGPADQLKVHVLTSMDQYYINVLLLANFLRCFGLFWKSIQTWSKCEDQILTTDEVEVPSSTRAPSLHAKSKALSDRSDGYEINKKLNKNLDRSAIQN